MGDRAGVCPCSDVRFQPCHRVLAQPPSLGEPAGELEAVDGHPRETGELHYLSDAKEFHGGISCDLPFRGAPFADVRGQSLIRFSGKVIPRSCVFCPNTSYSFRRVMVEGHQYSGWFPRSARCSSMGQPKRTPLETPPSRAYAEFLGHRCVAVWIGTAHWFTASSLFGNPAIGIAQSLSDTFSGIRPVDVSGFVVAELAGALTTLSGPNLQFQACLQPNTGATRISADHRGSDTLKPTRTS